MASTIPSSMRRRASSNSALSLLLSCTHTTVYHTLSVRSARIQKERRAVDWETLTAALSVYAGLAGGPSSRPPSIARHTHNASDCTGRIDEYEDNPIGLFWANEVHPARETPTLTLFATPLLHFPARSLRQTGHPSCHRSEGICRHADGRISPVRPSVRQYHSKHPLKKTNISSLLPQLKMWPSPQMTHPSSSHIQLCGSPCHNYFTIPRHQPLSGYSRSPGY